MLAGLSIGKASDVTQTNLRIALVKEHGFRVCELIPWDSEYKGIGDFLMEQAARKKQMVGLANVA